MVEKINKIIGGELYQDKDVDGGRMMIQISLGINSLIWQVVRRFNSFRGIIDVFLKKVLKEYAKIRG